MTLIDLFDDAIKIVLGAAIGLWGAKLHYGRERRKEKSDRRIAAIGKIGEDFAQAHAAAVDLSVRARTAIAQSRHPPSPSEHGTMIRAQILSAESRLALLGLKDCNQALWNYYAQLQLLFEKMGDRDDQGIQQLVRALQEANEAFFDQLHAEHKSTESS